ncbi:AfsR/SARP family transcriptional regulator [Actinophytocola oryzae]|uniref:DNA-binding SARP family transcriptional activator n=1 Tax=Actinophytocola oryzae TaxID=502181 RepID=A0A4R7VRQ4_9PSEU|nr:tetratricopeptide repeat protein [Actinophytocola oryzae]TDV52496.1 DNA-binding SARP family transcriptional activator [Actinophytocola oryzae]
MGVRVRVQVLGPVRAWRNGRELDLGPPGRRAVLGFLVLARGRALPRTELVDALWGSRPPPSATNIIQTHVKHLRRMLDPERDAYARSQSLPTVGEGYALRVPPDHVDLERFHGLVRTADETQRADRHEQAATALAEALRLWHGPPMADLPAFSSHPAVLALVAARRDAVLAYARVMIETGRAADVSAAVAEEAAAQPLDETLAATLMRVYAAAGQRAKAFAVYDATRRTLATELGVDPGQDLAEVHATLVRQEPRAVRPKAAPVPAELPADVAGFTGRATELSALDRLLAEPGAGMPICAVSGTAGVGKTALVLHWAQRVRDRFPDGQLYLDLRGYDPDQPMPVTEALARLLEALGVPGHGVPLTEDGRIARYRTEIADRRMLVVLDNAASVEQVRGLLPGTPSCFVVVTSRDSMAGLVALHGSHRLGLAPLSPDDAKTLLHELVGERAALDPAAAGDLVEQCARLPLALRVAAELAVTRAVTPLAHLAGELRDRQRRLRLLNAGGDPRAAVRTVLSWSYRHLPESAARLFRVLGRHPGADLDVHAAAALAGLAPEDTHELLDRLTRAHLVVLDSHGRYGMHDLLRAYAVELSAAMDSDVDRAAGMVRLLDHYLATTAAAMDLLYPKEGRHRTGTTPPVAVVPPDPRSWLDAERRNLVAACAHAATRGLAGHAVSLANTLYRYLEGGHHADALAVHTSGLRAAKESGDRAGEAHALTNLGAVYRLLGQYDPATDRLTQALELHRATGDRHGEARTLSNLGIVEDRLGQYEPASRHLSEALDRYRELANPYGIAAVLTNLGGLCLRPDNYAKAARYLTEAAQLFRELGDRTGEASALSNLGDADMNLGRYRQAEKHLDAALILFQDMKHRYGQAIALSNLGTVQTRLGRHDLAVEQLNAALLLFRETGHRYGEASVLNSLGEALHAAGLPEALAHHTAALRIATETGDKDEQDRAKTAMANLTTARLPSN